VRLQCSNYKESGSCKNSRRVYLDDIEALALKGLRQHLVHPEVITEFVDAYNTERKRLKKEANAERARIERRIGEIEARDHACHRCDHQGGRAGRAVSPSHARVGDRAHIAHGQA
jgi:hypothetical protein